MSAEWMVDPQRRPMIESSLHARRTELRKAAAQARNAYKKDYFGEPWKWFADALDEAADTLEKRIAAITTSQRGTE